MNEPEKTERKPAPPAETARQEGAQGRVGKPPSDTLGDGAVDVSDPNMVEETTDIADQVHANA